MLAVITEKVNDKSMTTDEMAEIIKFLENAKRFRELDDCLRENLQEFEHEITFTTITNTIVDHGDRVEGVVKFTAQFEGYRVMEMNFLMGPSSGERSFTSNFYNSYEELPENFHEFIPLDCGYIISELIREVGMKICQCEFVFDDLDYNYHPHWARIKRDISNLVRIHGLEQFSKCYEQAVRDEGSIESLETGLKNFNHDPEDAEKFMKRIRALRDEYIDSALKNA